MTTLKRIFQRKCPDRLKVSLVNHISTEPTDLTEENSGQENIYVIRTTDKFNAYLQPLDPVKRLSTLKKSPTKAKYFQELIDAAEQVKQGGNQNVKPIGCRESTEYFPSRMKHYLMMVEKFVDANFPALPPKPLPPTEEYLDDAMSVICNTVIGPVQYIGDLVLVKCLLDSFNRHLFGTLHLLVDRNLILKESFCLLQWMKKTYFREGLKGCLTTQNGVLSVTDPLLLADLLVYLKQKHLKLLQDKISTTLDNILQNKDNTGSCTDRNEETFIQVQLDVIQCLNASIKANETISHTLKNAVQRLCCDELHCFIKRYVNLERADKTSLLCHFRMLYTCRQLRCYAMSIIDKNNDTDSSTILMLTNMETQSLFRAQQCFVNIAKDNLKKYFNNEDEQLQNTIVTILKMIATLPQVEQSEEIKQLIVKTAHNSITRAYLQCLTRRKYKQLEKRWGDVEKRIVWDAEYFNFKFANQSESDDEQKMLMKVAEMLQCSDVNALKLLYSNLYSMFPEDSEKHIPPLLHWRGTLSRRQINEIIDVGRNVIGNTRKRDCVRSYPRICFCCCFLK